MPESQLAPLQHYAIVLLLVLLEWCLLAALGWAPWPLALAPAAAAAGFVVAMDSRDPELAGVLLGSVTGAGLLLVGPEHPLTAVGLVVAVGALPRSRHLRALQSVGLLLLWVATRPPFTSLEHALVPVAVLAALMLPLGAAEPRPAPQVPTAPAPPRPARARAARLALLEEAARGLSRVLDPQVTRALALVLTDPDAARGELLEMRQTLYNLRHLNAPPPTGSRVQRDLGNVFSTATELSRRLAPHEARLRVSPPPEASVFLDILCMRQALAPLLATAWANAGEGGTVALSADLVEAEVRLHVDDNGPGLPVGDPEELFDPLWSPSPEQASLGLGMALARAAATAMDARLEAGNSPLGGARFTLVLPVAPNAPTRTSRPPKEKRGRTVLMLGLDTTLNRALVRVLDKDWTPVEPGSPHPPSVLVCDLTGDATPQLAQLERLCRIWPALSRHTVVLADAIVLERVGPHPCALLKPVDATDIRRAVEQAWAGYDTPISLP